MTDTAAPPTAEQWAEYQTWLAGETARKTAAEGAKMSYSDVLHRLVADAQWRHTGERDAAHAAIAEKYPPAEAAATAEPESGRVPYVAV